MDYSSLLTELSRNNSGDDDDDDDCVL